MYKPGEYSASTTELDVRMPKSSLSGPMNAMHLTFEIPGGALDLTLAADQVLYPNGTGLFPFLGGDSYYYSLPQIKTTGTLTLNGRTSNVTGKSWLDRQWGKWDRTQLKRWTWMAIQFDDGTSINLWDLIDLQGEKAWATTRREDGTHTVAVVKPLANHAGDFRTSPSTGQTYAGRWFVEIPSLGARLTVTAKPVLQEIQAGFPFSPGINEASSVVTGVYQGRAVTGRVYVEQFGNWK